MSFESLKSSRKDELTKLINAASKSSSKNADERFWKPTVDKVGNGFAVIRFLPNPDESKLPWTQWYDHGFKGPTGKWYFEKSLTSIDQDDPVSEMNSFLWNTNDDAKRDQCRTQKRRLHYASNIMVITDKDNPENEGQVFLFKYGKKIFDKIKDAMKGDPLDDEIVPINPFDFWEGAEFKLKIRQVEGYRNYDKSEFGPIKKLGTEAKLKSVYKSLISLDEFTDPKTFKTYEELTKKLASVFGSSGVPGSVAKMVDSGDPAPAIKSAEAKQDEDNLDMTMADDSDDESEKTSDPDMMDFFKKLADDE